MAWLGERFNTITGKISDFTKEVILLDNSGGEENPSISSSQEVNDLSQLCRNQDSTIKQLLLQKEEMENSLVELDKQHEEAIVELLTQKQQLVTENKLLKKQLMEVEEASAQPADTLNHTTPLIQGLSWNDPLTTEMANIISFLKDLSILSVLEPLKNQKDERVLKEQILKLEEVKGLLKEKDDTVDFDLSQIISKIDNYISFLTLICNHRQELLPVLEETLSFMHNNAMVVKKSDKCDCSCDEAQSQVLVCNEKLPVSVQTEFVIEPAKLCSKTYSQYCQTDSCLYSPNHEFVKLSYSDSSCQTDSEFTPSADCLESSSKGSESVVDERINQEYHQTFSVALQTDCVCHCDSLRSELDRTLASMSFLKKELDEKEKSLLSQLEHQVDCAKKIEEKFLANQQFIAEKDKVILNQSNDISSLRCEVKTLHAQLNQLSQQQAVTSENSAIIKHNSIENNNFNGQGQLLMSVSDNDKLLLQQKLKSLDLEKTKLLYVLNEKSQECSNLKAEVHRLTSIVVSEKQALTKLQRDNKDLKQGHESSLDIDLTKEALQNLSRLVRDKDLEIEALKQKNSSLTDVVQQSTSGAEQIQSLMEERQDLMKKIAKFKAEREKIMARYNTKDQECRQQSSDIEKLKSELEQVSEKLELLQQQNHTVLQQYEDKQKLCVKMQDEVIVLKQRVTDLEHSEVDVKSKYAELLNQTNSDSVVIISREELTSKTEEIEKLKAVLKDKDDLIHEKDCLIHELSQQIKSIKFNAEQANSEINDVKKVNSDQLSKLNDFEVAIKKLWDEKEILSQRLSDKNSEVNLLKEINERLNMTVKEKEFSVQSLEEKISSLSLIIRGNTESPTSPADIDQILAESKEMYGKAQNFHRERDETLLALSQSQQEKQELKNEVQKLQSNEEHLKSELNRLRKHLLQIEENYTHEALKAETREKELRNQLAEVERSAKVSNSAVLDASYQANVQVASLQEQITMIAGQRDRALAQLSGLEDKVQQYAASLNNLQLVLEQMQKGHEQKMQIAEKKLQTEKNEIRREYHELQKVLELKQKQLEESSQALEAASRLSEQIDAKEEFIAQLKAELAKTENKLRQMTQEVDSIKSNSEGKVDRVVMKSLVLGYFSTPPGQKSEVVRLLARVLDFNQQEMAKAGIVVGKNTGTVVHRGLFSSFFGRLPLLNANQEQNSPKASSSRYSDDETQSFATLFVKFLENESQPIVPMPLPAEEMAREQTSKAKTKHSPRNQLLSASPERGSLLIGINSSFPTFASIPAVDQSSPTVLREILE